MVEIPRGSRNKYEYDPRTGGFYLDRMLFSSAVHYPADYGFIPDTLAEDGDPLDALVLVRRSYFPGCYIRVEPVGACSKCGMKKAPIRRSCACPSAIPSGTG
jgi:inorganic pyrophosphatase